MKEIKNLKKIIIFVVLCLIIAYGIYWSINWIISDRYIYVLNNVFASPSNFLFLGNEIFIFLVIFLVILKVIWMLRKTFLQKNKENNIYKD